MRKRQEDKIKLCPKCGSKKLGYSAGIDIGLIYAICENCSYKANSNMFPELTKKEAGKIRVIKGQKLLEIKSKNISMNRTSKWMMILIMIILISVFLAFALR